MPQGKPNRGPVKRLKTQLNGSAPTALLSSFGPYAHSFDLLTGDSVGMTFVSLNSAAAKSARDSASVRPRPPLITSIWRSNRFLKDGTFLGEITLTSIESSLPFSAMAGWRFLRRATLRSSSQLTILFLRKQTSLPLGTDSKMSHPITSQRPASPAEVTEQGQPGAEGPEIRAFDPGRGPAFLLQELLLLLPHPIRWV